MGKDVRWGLGRFCFVFVVVFRDRSFGSPPSATCTSRLPDRSWWVSSLPVELIPISSSWKSSPFSLLSPKSTSVKVKERQVFLTLVFRTVSPKRKSLVKWSRKFGSRLLLGPKGMVATYFLPCKISGRVGLLDRETSRTSVVVPGVVPAGE